MKKSFIAISLAISGLLCTASAATIQLIPGITGITGAAQNGSLTGSGITAADLSSWLGTRADGWYTTTGNADMRWGSATVNTTDQTVSLPNMNGTAGVCAGLKLTVPDMGAYEDMSFSFTLTPPSSGAANHTYSIWFGNKDGSLTKLSQETRNSSTAIWNVTYNLTTEQLADMNSNGDGKLYIVFGSTGGANGQTSVISDISLTASVPEPATSALGLLGLATLMLRRRVKA